MNSQNKQPEESSREPVLPADIAPKIARMLPGYYEELASARKDVMLRSQATDAQGIPHDQVGMADAEERVMGLEDVGRENPRPEYRP